MSTKNRCVLRVALFAAHALLTLSTVTHAGAHGGGHSSPRTSPASKQDKPAKPVGDLKLGANMIRPSHGGQVVASKWHYFEVVYTPNETRVYVYSPSKRPMNPVRVQGEIAMRVNGSEDTLRYALAPAANLRHGDVPYLAATVDVSRIRDGDMQCEFNFERMPYQEESQVRFVQTFALSRPPTTAEIVPPAKAQRQFVERQAAFPVAAVSAGNAAGLYSVADDRPRREPSQSIRAPRLVVADADDEDTPAIRAQVGCPVSNRPFVAGDAPVKIEIDGQVLFVCSRQCAAEVVQNPFRFVAQSGGDSR